MTSSSRPAALRMELGARRYACTACAFVATACGVVGAVVCLRLQEDTVLRVLQINDHSNGTQTGSHMGALYRSSVRDLVYCARSSDTLQVSPLSVFVVTLLAILSMALSLGGLLLLFWSLPSAGGDMHNMLVRPDVCFSVYFRHAWYPKVLGTC